MCRFLRKWYHRYVTYKVTLKYLSNSNSDHFDIDRGLENINLYSKNIVLKSGRTKKDDD
jgi:hypothetical protein